jgi:hypothetical protein
MNTFLSVSTRTWSQEARGCHVSELPHSAARKATMSLHHNVIASSYAAHNSHISHVQMQLWQCMSEVCCDFSYICADNPTILNLAARTLVMQRHTEPKPVARPHGPSIFSYCHAVVLHSGSFFLRAGSEPGLTVEQDWLPAGHAPIRISTRTLGSPMEWLSRYDRRPTLYTRHEKPSIPLA